MGFLSGTYGSITVRSVRLEKQYGDITADSDLNVHNIFLSKGVLEPGQREIIKPPIIKLVMRNKLKASIVLFNIMLQIGALLGSRALRCVLLDVVKNPIGKTCTLDFAFTLQTFDANVSVPNLHNPNEVQIVET